VGTSAATAVVVDAMGGDHAPAATVQGAVEAARLHGIKVVLVGRAAELRRELDRTHDHIGSIEIVDAPEVVSMDEAAATSMRAKRNSSLAVAARMVRDGEGLALVTAGNTGAAMVTAKLTWGMIEGVERPALAATVPGIDHQTLLLDVGANVNCKPHHLAQFAVMGHFYSQAVMGVARPRIGLLSVGEEEGKGDRLTQDAYRLLEAAGVHFVGNVEGRAVYANSLDVVVCDGFVGNVVLKVSEGLGEMVFGLLKREARRRPLAAAGFLLAKGAFTGFRKQVDYSEYGGAPLLGVKGACLVGHGRSNAKAIRNAVRVAHAYATRGVIDHIEERLARLDGRRAAQGG
jgi:phosphate acyltransferase